MNSPTATLANGITVANFSSPHPFTFDDGTVLPACSADHAREMMLNANEKFFEGIKGSQDVSLTFELNPTIVAHLNLLQHNQEIDVIIVPLPVLTAIKSAYMCSTWSKCRVVRVADRVTKTLHSGKFCI